MSTPSRVIRNTGYLYIKMAISIIISLYSTRILLQALGTSDFGIFTIVGGTIAMLGFLNSSMANATQRFMSFAEGESSEERKLKVFNVSMILHIIIAFLTSVILLIAFFPLFNGVLSIESSRIFAAKIVYLSLVVSSIFAIVNVPYDAVMTAHENMLFYSILGVVESILKLLIAFFCLSYYGDKLILYGILISALPLFTLNVMKIYCHMHYSECKYSFRKYYDWALMKEIACFSGWNFLTSISNLLSGQGIGIVLNHYFGTTSNASHGIAQQVNSQLCAFAENMKKALNPVIVKKAGANELDSMNYASLLGCKFGFLLTAIFAIPLIIEMPYVLGLWLKNIPDYAILFCRLQLIQSLVTQSTASIATSIYAQGRIKFYAIWKSIMNIAPIFVTCLIFKIGGGPVWLYIPMILIWGVGGNCIILHYANVLCQQRVKDWLTVVLIPIISVISLMSIGGLICEYFFPMSFFRLILCCFVSTAILLISTWYLGLRKREKILFNDYVKNVKSRLNRN